MSSANWTTNVVLFALVIILSFFTYTTSKQNDKDNTVPALTTLVPDEVHRIQIDNDGRLTLIEKKNDAWHITKPIDVRANQFRIGTLLKLLTSNNYARYAIEGIDLAKYGLLDPALKVQIDDTVISFGSTNPVNEKRYILLDDSMYLIEDNFYPLINSQIGTLVDLNLIPDDAGITRIVTTGFTVMQDEAGRWTSTDKSSTDDVMKTVTNWKKAQAFGVHDYVQRKTLDEIDVTLDNGSTPVHFLVTDKEPWLIIARPDLNLEYHFDQSYVGQLLSNHHDTTTIEDGQ